MMRSTQAATDRVQKLRVEYWEKVKNIDPNNLVFLDETGVLLGLARTHARSQQGTRAYDLKPFYRGAKITAIGAISIDRASMKECGVERAKILPPTWCCELDAVSSQGD